MRIGRDRHGQWIEQEDPEELAHRARHERIWAAATGLILVGAFMPTAFAWNFGFLDQAEPRSRDLFRTGWNELTGSTTPAWSVLTSQAATPMQGAQVESLAGGDTHAVLFSGHQLPGPVPPPSQRAQEMPFIGPPLPLDRDALGPSGPPLLFAPYVLTLDGPVGDLRGPDDVRLPRDPAETVDPDMSTFDLGKRVKKGLNKMVEDGTPLMAPSGVLHANS